MLISIFQGHQLIVSNSQLTLVQSMPLSLRIYLMRGKTKQIVQKENTIFLPEIADKA